MVGIGASQYSDRMTHAVITGANTGIGYVTALELVRSGVHVTLAGRSPEKNARARHAIVEATGSTAVDVVALDLADLDSVRTCAETLARGPRIDLLVNNAGLGGIRGTTRQGFELTFGTNHLGHYLLTRLLVDQLGHLAPGARVIHVSSRTHEKAKRPAWDTLVGETRTFTGLPEYAVSKLANVLFTAELARRDDPSRFVALSLHPGRVATDIFKRIPRPLQAIHKIVRPMITPEQGAATTLHCATAPAAQLTHGGYFSNCRLAEPAPLARDAALARELWERSAAWVALPA